MIQGNNSIGFGHSSSPHTSSSVPTNQLGTSPPPSSTTPPSPPHSSSTAPPSLPPPSSTKSTSPPPPSSITAPSPPPPSFTTPPSPPPLSSTTPLSLPPPSSTTPLPLPPPTTTTAPSPILSPSHHSQTPFDSQASIKQYKQVLAGLAVTLITCFCIIVGLLVNTFTLQKSPYWEARARVFESVVSDLACQKNINSKKFSEEEVGTSLYLTPYIRAGDLATARRKAEVHHALGDVLSYSGYITVDTVADSVKHLFFWMIPSSVEPHKAPLILWLQGGPGWPSMYGLFKENGPYFIELVEQGEDLPSSILHKNPYSWHTVANVIYIDNPVGTGFSFTTKDSGYPSTDLEVAADLVEALVQIMRLYPALVPGAKSKETPFYIFGESYGGPYSISLAYNILQQSPGRPELAELINLRGIGLGNALINPRLQFKYSDYINAVGYMSPSQMQKMRNFQDKIVAFIDNNQSKAGMFEFMQMFSEFRTELNQTHPYTHGFTNNNVYDITLDSDYLLKNEYYCYLQDPAVLRDIHVGQQICNQGQSSYNHLEGVILTNKAWMLEHVLDHMEVLIYNGNMDVMVNTVGANSVINNLTWSGSQEFGAAGSRPFRVGGRLIGYGAQGGNLTYVVVRNSGHMVPISQPEAALALVRNFVSQKNN